MNRHLHFVLLLCIALFSTTMYASVPTHKALSFVENKGQITDQYGHVRRDIDFKLSTDALDIFIGRGKLHYQWTQIQDSLPRLSFLESTDPIRLINTYRMDMELTGANDRAKVHTSAQGAYYEKYYGPSFGEQGLTVHSFDRIVYKDIYPNIDWVLYIKDEKLEYDFVIHKGGTVAAIQMAFKGATDLRITEGGQFVATTPMGYISESAPYTFQEDGHRVSSSFALSGNQLSFHTGSFEGKLTIDPVVIWATYIGGQGGYMDLICGMTVAKEGNLYIAGETFSSGNIATSGAYQIALGGRSDGFIKKFNSKGEQIWGTYYGGPGFDDINSIASDSFDFLYVAGSTSNSSGMATPGSHQPQYGGGATVGANGDAFFAKFDSSGTRLWSSYYGGGGTERNVKLTLQDSYFILSGNTSSTNQIATPGTHKPARSEAVQNAFVAKFDLEGKREWGTYYGGNLGTTLTGTSNTGIAVDNKGNIYLSGLTYDSVNIATSGTHQPVKNDKSYDCFLVRLDREGKRVWGTYFGGEADEEFWTDGGNDALACDNWGNIYLSGFTKSTKNIATSGSHKPMISGDKQDVFLAKFADDGTRQWATYFGGSEADIAPVLHYVDSNNIFISGSTQSPDSIASPYAFQPVYAGGMPYGDAFIAKFNSSGNFLYGSYYGGSGAEWSSCLTDDRKGNVYIAGATNSVSGIATTGSHQSTYPGAMLVNSFLAKICFEVPSALIKIIGEDSICANATPFYSIEEIEGATDYIWNLPSGWTGVEKGNKIEITSMLGGGMISVQVVKCSDTSAPAHREIFIRPKAPADIRVNGFTLSTVVSYQSYQWLLNGTKIPGATNGTYAVVENGDYQVITINEWGCTDTSDSYAVKNVAIPNRDLAHSIRISPNPASNFIHIQSPIPTIVQINSIDGKLILRRQNEQNIDISALSPGLYILQIMDEQEIMLKAEKVVKM